MNRWYMGVAKISTGVMIATANAQPLGQNIPCRRISICCEFGVQAYIVSQDHRDVTRGFPIPQMQADGNFSWYEMWVNNVSVPWIVTQQGNATVHWIAEEV